MLNIINILRVLELRAKAVLKAALNITGFYNFYQIIQCCRMPDLSYQVEDTHLKLVFTFSNH